MKALLIDDDPWALRLLEADLLDSLPGIVVTTREVLDLSGSFDVYFLDNRIGERAQAVEGVAEVRRRSPGALVLVHSAHLSRAEIKRLTQLGCDGVFDKGDPSDIDSMIEIVQEYGRALRQPKPAAQGLTGAVRAIRGLLSEWNRRLDSQEALR